MKRNKKQEIIEETEEQFIDHKKTIFDVEYGNYGDILAADAMLLRRQKGTKDAQP